MEGVVAVFGQHKIGRGTVPAGVAGDRGAAGKGDAAVDMVIAEIYAAAVLRRTVALDAAALEGQAAAVINAAAV